MKNEYISYEQMLDVKRPKFRWPLTKFGTLLLVAIGMAIGLSVGVYINYECLAIRGF